jgi:hypothetical protein
MLTLRVTEDELTQLRRIDHAARRLVEALERRPDLTQQQWLQREYGALIKALFEAPSSSAGASGE